MENETESKLRTFVNVLQVVEYLKAEGWKLAKSAAYLHVKNGMLRPRDNGNFHERDVLKYAQTFLRMKDGSTVTRELESLSREKASAELRIINANAIIREQRAQIVTGSLVPKSGWDMELAARAGILIAGLQGWIQMHAADWIRLVDGNTGKVSELIRYMSNGLDEHFNEFCKSRDYEVIFFDDENDLDAETDTETDPDDNGDDEGCVIG